MYAGPLQLAKTFSHATIALEFLEQALIKVAPQVATRCNVELGCLLSVKWVTDTGSLQEGQNPLSSAVECIDTPRVPRSPLVGCSLGYVHQVVCVLAELVVYDEEDEGQREAEAAHGDVGDAEERVAAAQP